MNEIYTFYVSDTMLGTRDRVENKIKTLLSRNLHSSGRDRNYLCMYVCMSGDDKCCIEKQQGSVERG